MPVIQVTLPLHIVALIDKQKRKETPIRGFTPTRGLLINEAVQAVYGNHSRNHPRPKRSRNAAAGTADKRTHRGSVERPNGIAATN